MSTIKNTIHIMTVAAGTPTAQVFYEVQTSDSIPKRMIVARLSEQDPALYFLDREALKEYGIINESVIDNIYEDEWPADLSVQLTTEGTLPVSWNAQFATADFGKGKSGTLLFNNYDPMTGSFTPVTKTVYASTAAAAAEAELPWYKKPLVQMIGYTALALGVVVGLIVGFGRKK